MADAFERGDAGVGGSSVRPVYSEREMRCYAVTEMELRQLGQAAIFVTLFSSLGSLALGLSLDVFKDLYIGDAADASALRVANLVQKGAFIAGVVCFLVAGAFALQRKSVTDLIKRESKT